MRLVLKQSPGEYRVNFHEGTMPAPTPAGASRSLPPESAPPPPSTQRRVPAQNYNKLSDQRCPHHGRRHLMQAHALQLLRQALADNTATFRDGQWQAISALVQRKAQLLVVQRTGWGKSLVYSLATRFLRDQGAGCTILISPLLSLMRNQISAARRIGVRAETINSTNETEWRRIEAALHRNEIDVLLILSLIHI